MSCTITKKELSEVVQKVNKFVPKNSSLFILRNLKISMNGSFKINATDIDNAIQIERPIKSDNTAAIAINGKHLVSLVKSLPDEPLNLDIVENALNISTASGTTWKIEGDISNDFPVFPGDNSESGAANMERIGALAISSIKDIVDKTAFAVYGDIYHASLAGIYLYTTEEMRKNDEGFIAVGCDGNRLVEYNPAPFNALKPFSAIVNPAVLAALPKLTKNDVNISVNEKYIHFSNADFSLYSKLIEGPYPDYKKVIPISVEKLAFVNRAKLIDTVNRLAVMANAKTHLLKFQFSAGALKIYVGNNDLGMNAEETIPIEYYGPDHLIGFNAKYLAEILEKGASETVKITMTTVISGVSIRSVLENNTYNLLMPLRITEND